MCQRSPFTSPSRCWFSRNGGEMKKILLFFLFLMLPLTVPAAAETSYKEFLDYSYSWLGEDPDSLWRMTRNEVQDRLSRQNAFRCKALYNSSLKKSYYLCRSNEKFSGKYRMRFYFSDYGLLEAIEFRAEDDYIRELAECYDGQIPIIHTMWKQVRDRYGENERYYVIDNDIFTDGPGKISAQTGIGNNTYSVFGQNVLQYSFDNYAVMYLFCSNSYITSHISKR